MSALASAYVVEDEHGSATCAGCARRLRLDPDGRRKGPHARKPVAYSEDRDVFGRLRVWCRRCTMRLWAAAG